MTGEGSDRSGAEGLAPREDRWLRRRRIGPDSMINWSVQEWIDWWSDGLQIWFSNAPRPDRELAFAPVRVIAEREDLPSALLAILSRFTTHDPHSMAAGVERARSRQARLEQSILDVMGRRFDLDSENKALLLLAVSIGLRARRMPEVIRAALSAWRNHWFYLAAPGEFQSHVARAVFEGFTSADLAPMRLEIEDMLKTERNFRTVLSYCLKAYRDEFALCIQKFGDIWQFGQGSRLSEVWAIVADRLNNAYSKTVVMASLEIIRTNANVNVNLIGFVSAEKLAPFYPLEQRGLFTSNLDAASRSDPAFRRRGLEINVDA